MVAINRMLNSCGAALSGVFLWFFRGCNRPDERRVFSFLGGFTLGQLYYVYMWKDIALPGHLEASLLLILSILWGIGNAVSIQFRCISLLTIPLYCGKPGRAVLKAVVLIYVVAGPITNMGTNAREVVRLYACTTQLAHNLTRERYSLLAAPFRQAALRLQPQLDETKDVFRSFENVMAPLEVEMEHMRNYSISDEIIGSGILYDSIEKKHKTPSDEIERDKYNRRYLAKVKARCEEEMSREILSCMESFRDAYNVCSSKLPKFAAGLICWPLRVKYVCNLKRQSGLNVCDPQDKINPSVGMSYMYLKQVKKELTGESDVVKIQYKGSNVRELYNIQDAQESGDRVIEAFQEKQQMMRYMRTAVQVCCALLMLRVLAAAVRYHERYLCEVTYDNIYVTNKFKRLDAKRNSRGSYSLLPLKKMERIKYIDVHSTSYVPAQRSHLLAQLLKVMLEVVTATTFVMLDRLFYEALDVVRQHADQQVVHQDEDISIQVVGTGAAAGVIRQLLGAGVAHDRKRVDRPCLPQPSLMPAVYFVKIYGGYLWILLLLYTSPYTTRLRRLTCSYFYPRRERQRILHLYNDILKKRMKLQKNLQKTAVQAVRAHYLSGESVLSIRMKFPQVLGWLRVFPAGRMSCLICGETEPTSSQAAAAGSWQRCAARSCPFVYCGECWRDAGGACLACDPRLAMLSDADSRTEDEFQHY